MKILIVDNSRAMRMMVSRALRHAGYEGYELDEAESGRVALEKLKSGTDIQLVLCDWHMPEMTGLQLLKLVRGLEMHVPFGFITSETHPRFHREATEEGASFLVTKPFTPEGLRHVLGPYLE